MLTNSIVPPDNCLFAVYNGQAISGNIICMAKAIRCFCGDLFGVFVVGSFCVIKVTSVNVCYIMRLCGRIEVMVQGILHMVGERLWGMLSLNVAIARGMCRSFMLIKKRGGIHNRCRPR